MRANPKKTTQIGVRFDAEARALVERAAARDRRVLSDWIRVVSESAAQGDKPRVFHEATDPREAGLIGAFRSLPAAEGDRVLRLLLALGQAPEIGQAFQALDQLIARAGLAAVPAAPSAHTGKRGEGARRGHGKG